PYPHSSRSTHTSSTILAAQFMLTTPLEDACSVVSRKVDFLISFTQLIVPSWFTTSTCTDSDFSLQLTFRKIKFKSSFSNNWPFCPIGRFWLSTRVNTYRPNASFSEEKNSLLSRNLPFSPSEAA